MALEVVVPYHYNFVDAGAPVVACAAAARVKGRHSTSSSSQSTQRDIANLARNVRATSAKTLEGGTALSPDFQPGPRDVICARGKTALQHSGNRRLRVLIGMSLEKYSQSKTKVEKSSIVSSIIDAVREASPDGGFVKEEDGSWYEVGDHIAREKVGQCFRDQLHTKYKSSTKAKKRRRKEQEQQELHQQQGSEAGNREAQVKADNAMRPSSMQESLNAAAAFMAANGHVPTTLNAVRRRSKQNNKHTTTAQSNFCGGTTTTAKSGFNPNELGIRLNPLLSKLPSGNREFDDLQPHLLALSAVRVPTTLNAVKQRTKQQPKLSKANSISLKGAFSKEALGLHTNPIMGALSCPKPAMHENAAVLEPHAQSISSVRELLAKTLKPGISTAVGAGGKSTLPTKLRNFNVMDLVPPREDIPTRFSRPNPFPQTNAMPKWMI